jgi:hypothetical protein
MCDGRAQDWKRREEYLAVRQAVLPVVWGLRVHFRAETRDRTAPRCLLDNDILPQPCFAFGCKRVASCFDQVSRIPEPIFPRPTKPTFI